MKALINAIKLNENAQVFIFFGVIISAFAALGYILIHFGTVPCFGF